MFAVDRGVCRTVSQLFGCVLDLSFDLVWSNCECVIRPEVTLCGRGDAKMHELIN